MDVICLNQGKGYKIKTGIISGNWLSTKERKRERGRGKEKERDRREAWERGKEKRKREKLAIVHQ